MRKGVRDIFGFCLLGMFLALYVQVVLGACCSKPEDYCFAAGKLYDKTVQYTLPDGWININEAEAEDLLLLPGIGETIAGNILTERQLNGPFYYPEDLLAVKGIGTTKLGQIREYISFSLFNSNEIGE